MKTLFSSIVLAVTLSMAVTAQISIPNVTRDMMSKVPGETDFDANGESCPASWWDIFFTFNVTDAAGNGTAAWQIVKPNGDSVTVAGFELRNGLIVYTVRHGGAAVWQSQNQWIAFWEEQIIDPAWKLHVSFDMAEWSPWSGCTRLKFVSTGSLEVKPISAVLNKKDCGVCQQGQPTCQTIKMRAPWWFANQPYNMLARHTVRQFGMSFGNEVSAAHPVVIQQLRQGTNNGHAAAYQLQFSFQQVPPQSAGYPACYGVKFDPVTLSAGETVTDKTLCFEINRLLKVSISRNNASDFLTLMPIIKALNLVGN